MEEENHLIKDRIKKLEELRKLGIEPYEYRYEPTHRAKEIAEKYSTLAAEEKTKDKVRVAGRLITFRRMGKATFANLQDFTGKIQLYFREDDIGKQYELLKLLDMGDIIGCEGIIFKTKTGEVTVYVEKFMLLTKSLRPLPEKWHGLKDEELRHRQRYVDLIVNPEVREKFVMRSKVVEAMREFLIKDGFLEVETPTLQPIYGGGAAKPFVTQHHALKMSLYLRISDEMYLKRLIVGGFDKVFEICKDFRNEGIDTHHNPEFTMMETMSAYDNYEDSMKRTERMFEFIAKKVLGTTEIEYLGRKLSLKAPFKRLKMADGVKKATGVDFLKLKDVEEARKVARKFNVEIREDMGIGAIMAAISSEVVEPKIVEPTFLMEYPKEVSPLSKPMKANPEFVERFEILICGMEFGNVYSEGNDPAVLRENWQHQEELLKKGNEEAQRTDEDFINAMEYGMPPTSGIGIGIDRLAMLLTNTDSIRDVIFFPTLRERE